MSDKIIVVSAAEEGYRNLPEDLQDSTEKLHSLSGYSVIQPRWIRHRLRDGAFEDYLRVASTIESESLPALDFDFLKDHERWYASLSRKSGLPLAFADTTDLSDLLEEFAEELGALGLVKGIANAIGFAKLDDREAIFREKVFPAFFESYPKGQIHILSERYSLDEPLVGMRYCFTASQFPRSEWPQAGIDRLGMLREWHGGRPEQLGRAIMTLSHYLWYPYITGHTSGPAGLLVSFQFDIAEEFSPRPFPTDWLAYPLQQANYGGESTPAYSCLQPMEHPEHKKLSHRRHISNSYPSVEDRSEFFRWLVPRLSRFLFELCDVANFTTDRSVEADIDPKFAFEHLLTVERIVRRTLAASSIREVATMKGIVFEVADLWDTLSVRFKSTKQETEFFKSLFNPTTAAPFVGNALQQIPGVGDSLHELCENVYSDLEAKVMASVWVKSKLTNSGVLVRNAKLDSESEMPRGEFVANVIRALRNGHHGYFTEAHRSHRPSRFLALVDGNIPDSIGALPALWLFAYLADFQFIGWKTLDIAIDGS